MGVSSTTGIVLELATRLHNPKDVENSCTDEEIEAFVNGMAQFWDSTLKQLTGEYHTPAEVLATYNAYLAEKFNYGINEPEEK